MTKTKSSTMPQDTEPLDIRILTHNIRYATTAPFPGEEPWTTRCPLLCSELRFNSILPSTFICLQEVLHSQLLDILSSLNTSSPSSSPEWNYVGVGRDDGLKAGEYSPILYRPSTFRLNHYETKWLSPTPSIPSKGWDASSIRIVTIAHFTHISSSKTITTLNTHLDNEGSLSRVEAAKMILTEIRGLGKNESEKPAAVLLAGDFNSPPDDGAYKVMTSSESIMEDIGVKLSKDKKIREREHLHQFWSYRQRARENRLRLLQKRRWGRVSHVCGSGK